MVKENKSPEWREGYHTGWLEGFRSVLDRMNSLMQALIKVEEDHEEAESDPG